MIPRKPRERLLFGLALKKFFKMGKKGKHGKASQSRLLAREIARIAEITRYEGSDLKAHRYLRGAGNYGRGDLLRDLGDVCLHLMSLMHDYESGVREKNGVIVQREEQVCFLQRAVDEGQGDLLEHLLSISRERDMLREELERAKQ